MPRYIHTVTFECAFVGDYGSVEVETDDPDIDPRELYEMALEHFQPDACVTDTEEIDDDDDDEETE